MRRRVEWVRIVGLSAALLASGCATSPKRTVLNLDTTDPKWTSRRCVAARKEAFEYNEHVRAKLVLGTAGNLVVPFAGTGAAVAWNESQNKSKKRLNAKIERACASRHPGPPPDRIPPPADYKDRDAPRPSPGAPSP